jgi:hypothetical protein
MRELFDKLLPIFLENGGKLFEFYEMTYGEINMVIDSNRRKIKQEYQMAANLAYQTGRLSTYALSESPMPPIREVFPGLFDDAVEKKEVKQDWETMRNNLLIYADMHNANKERGG